MILVVIDMQPEFVNEQFATNAELIKGCRAEVDEARRKGWPIIFLEYTNAGNTFPLIKEGVDGYHKSFTKLKSRDDGSEQIMEVINEHDLHSKSAHIHVCGVNCNCCVKRTVEGLAHRLPHCKIQVGTTNSDGQTPLWATENAQVVWQRST